jgi:glycosyltransferase involved in cell wall biosynthesis
MHRQVRDGHDNRVAAKLVTVDHSTGKMTTTLTVLVPAYNEQYLIEESLRRLKILNSYDHLSRVQVVVIDDSSADGTAKILQNSSGNHNNENGKLNSSTSDYAQRRAS